MTLVLLDILPQLLILLHAHLLTRVQLVVAAQIHVALQEGDHVAVEAATYVNKL